MEGMAARGATHLVRVRVRVAVRVRVVVVVGVGPRVKVKLRFLAVVQGATHRPLGVFGE